MILDLEINTMLATGVALPVPGTRIPGTGSIMFNMSKIKIYRYPVRDNR